MQRNAPEAQPDNWLPRRDKVQFQRGLTFERGTISDTGEFPVTLFTDGEASEALRLFRQLLPEDIIPWR